MNYKYSIGGGNNKYDFTLIYDINLSKLNDMGWYNIKNYGQFNCGIFLNDKIKDRLIKCEKKTNIEKEEIVDHVNKIKRLFPSIYNVYIEKEQDKKYVEMQKLDGDLTKYIFTDLVLEILNNMQNLSNKQREQLFTLFYMKLPKTLFSETVYLDDSLFVLLKYDRQDVYKFFELNDKTNPRIIGEYKSIINLYDKIKDFDVTYDKFLELILNFVKRLNEEKQILEEKINYLYEELNNIGYDYDDHKLDNIGYIKKNNDIELYFIDFDGVIPLRNQPSSYKKIENFGVHGQYNLKYISTKLIKNDDNNILNLSYDLHQISQFELRL